MTLWERDAKFVQKQPTRNIRQFVSIVRKCFNTIFVRKNSRSFMYSWNEWLSLRASQDYKIIWKSKRAKVAEAEPKFPIAPAWVALKHSTRSCCVSCRNPPRMSLLIHCSSKWSPLLLCTMHTSHLCLRTGTIGITCAALAFPCNALETRGGTVRASQQSQSLPELRKKVSQYL